METKSIPCRLCLLTKSLVLLTFTKLRSKREAGLLFSRVVITSKGKGSRSYHLIIIRNTKRHPNNTKTDQLPIFDVISGLLRPYHNTSPTHAMCTAVAP